MRELRNAGIDFYCFKREKRGSGKGKKNSEKRKKRMRRTILKLNPREKCGRDRKGDTPRKREKRKEKTKSPKAKEPQGWAHARKPTVKHVK